MKKEKIGQFAKKYKLQILCIAAGLALFVLATLFAPKEGNVVTSLKREGYGTDYSDELVVSGISDEDVVVSIPVGGRRFSDEEIEGAFERCMEDLIEIIPGENTGLQEVRSDLKFPDSMSDYGFELLWSSGDPEVVSSSGEVKNEDFFDKGIPYKDVDVRVNLSDGEREAAYTVPVRVLPLQLTEEEEKIKRFLNSVEENDRASLSEETVILPDTFEGEKIGYKSNEKTNYHFIWILGIVLAVLLTVRERESLKEKQDKRQKQMQLDYPEIVSKLLVFIESGMNLRVAWDHIAQDYEQWEKAGNKKDVRFAYEEMCRANTRLRTGAPEGRVYRDFGRTCRIKQYMKLAGLLEQNRRSGVANLKSILQMEMVEAWEERKNVARRSGEEAGTKLLLPLLMMLGIVMVMIMVPAMMSF